MMGIVTSLNLHGFILATRILPINLRATLLKLKLPSHHKHLI